MIGLYLIARIPERGVLVKQPIEVRPDPHSGQLVSIADERPPAALLLLQVPLPRRRPQPADHPAGLRDLQHHGPLRPLVGA